MPLEVGQGQNVGLRDFDGGIRVSQTRLVILKSTGESPIVEVICGCLTFG